VDYIADALTIVRTPDAAFLCDWASSTILQYLAGPVVRTTLFSLGQPPARMAILPGDPALLSTALAGEVAVSYFPPSKFTKTRATESPS
jgi:hypothetical protein